VKGFYRHGNSYDPAEQKQLDRYLRDYRTGEVRKFAQQVFDLLHDLMLSLGHPDGDIDVVCGYRAPRRSGYLRLMATGVARNSLHMRAVDIDIRIPGVWTTQLRDLHCPAARCCWISNLRISCTVTLGQCVTGNNIAGRY
jgi:uncharacterized protein YcbK (DUF882 family)